MKIWKNTNTLDELFHDIKLDANPGDAEIALIGSKSINLNMMPNLIGIFKCGVGTDNVPFEEASERGIKICLPSDTTKKYIYEETANYTVYLILNMLYREVGVLDTWTKNARSFLGDKNVLVIGAGNIGKFVINKIKRLVNVTTFDLIHNEMSELCDLIKNADLITLHIPLLPTTKDFLDREKLSWMKDGSVLVNTARGPIVNEKALTDEISNGRIKAAFDVFWQEPYQGPLKQYHPERFFMSPHVSSNCVDFLKGLAVDFKTFLKDIKKEN